MKREKMKHLRMKSKKAMYFSVFLVLLFIAFATFTFVVLEKKYSKLSKNKAIGERQMELLQSYAKGEKAMYYIDRAAEISAEEAVYDLAQSSELASGDCEAIYDESFSSPVWQEDNKECYPSSSDVLRAYTDVFNIRLIGYLLKSNQDDVKYPSSFSLTFEDNLLSGFANDDLVVGLSEMPIKGQIGTFGGQCHYCRKTKEIFNLDCGDTCCAAPCPKDSLILEVPYLNQCSYNPQTACYGRTVCSSGCGPTSTTMAMNYLLEEDREPFPVYQIMCGNLGVYRPGGSWPSLVQSQPREVGFKTGLKEGISWEEVQTQLSKNNPIVAFQRQKGYSCTSSSNSYRCACARGHVVLIVGVSEDYVILNEPFTGTSQSYCRYEFGDHMVVPKSAFDMAWAARSRRGIIISNDDDI